jgi:type I restriction enzyme S subunit
VSEEWPRVALGDLADLKIGRTPPRDQPRYWTTDLERPFCTIADMRGVRAVSPSREGVTDVAEAEGKAKRVPAGSLLMSFKLTIGRTAFAARDLFPNEAIVWIQRKDSNVDLDYLRLYLPLHDYTSSVGVAVKGKTLNQQTLATLDIPLPPIEEQERIARLGRVLDLTVERAEEVVQQAAALLKLTRDELVADAELVSFGELITKIEVGESPRCLDRRPEPEEWGVLKVSAVRPARFDPNEAKALPSSAKPKLAAQVKPGDLLMSRSNTFDRVGAACVVDVEADNLLLCDLIFRLGLAEGADPTFIAHALSTGRVREQIEANAVGTSGSMKKVNQSIIRELQVPLLSPEEQVAATGLLADYADAVRASQQALSSARTLRNAIVAELVLGSHVIPSTYDSIVESLGSTVEPELTVA